LEAQPEIGGLAGYMGLYYSGEKRDNLGEIWSKLKVN
jgi:hypothetical protein